MSRHGHDSLVETSKRKYFWIEAFSGEATSWAIKRYSTSTVYIGQNTLFKRIIRGSLKWCYRTHLFRWRRLQRKPRFSFKNRKSPRSRNVNYGISMRKHCFSSLPVEETSKGGMDIKKESKAEAFFFLEFMWAVHRSTTREVNGESVGAVSAVICV